MTEIYPEIRETPHGYVVELPVSIEVEAEDIGGELDYGWDDIHESLVWMSEGDNQEFTEKDEDYLSHPDIGAVEYFEEENSLLIPSKTPQGYADRVLEALIQGHRDGEESLPEVLREIEELEEDY
jgi:hypothetical protein